jgi:hypothetical protein
MQNALVFGVGGIMDLFVGKTFFELRQSEATAYLTRCGIDSNRIASINPAETIASFGLLNCVTLFTDHVIELEGYANRHAGYEAMYDGSFRQKQMPAWEDSDWMPFEFEPPGCIANDVAPWIGSCQALLRELDDVAARSPLSLATLPSHYLLKPDGPDLSFDGTQFSNAEAIRWVWRCLHDGAQVAIRENSVLSGTPE